MGLIFNTQILVLALGSAVGSKMTEVGQKQGINVSGVGFYI